MPLLKLVGLIIAPLPNTGGTSGAGVGYPYVVDRILNDPSIPDELRLELLRAGFIELDAPGLDGPARYIDSDQVAEVAADVVRLRSVHHVPTTRTASRAGPRVTLGATVRTADGQDIGKVDRLIVDPYTLSIRALVVRRGLLPARAVEIPLVAIPHSSGKELQLRYSADQVRRLPEFVDAYYAAPPTGFVPPAAYTRDSLLWPLGVPLLPPPPPQRNETAVRDVGRGVVYLDLDAQQALESAKVRPMLKPQPVRSAQPS